MKPVAEGITFIDIAGKALNNDIFKISLLENYRMEA